MASLSSGSVRMALRSRGTRDDALSASGNRELYLTRVVDALCEIKPKSEDETFVYLDPKVREPSQSPPPSSSTQTGTSTEPAPFASNCRTASRTHRQQRRLPVRARHVQRVPPLRVARVGARAPRQQPVEQLFLNVRR